MALNDPLRTAAPGDAEYEAFFRSPSAVALRRAIAADQAAHMVEARRISEELGVPLNNRIRLELGL